MIKYKKIIAILLLMVSVGLLTYLPQIISAEKIGSKFKGVYKQINDDEIYYLARAREVVDGHTKNANPYLYEYKNGEPMQFWLPDFILAYPLKIFDINVVKGYQFYDLVLPAVIALFCYLLLYKLSKSWRLSVLAASFLHLGLYLEYFSRTPSPQFIFIFWIALFLSFIYFLQVNNKKSFYLATCLFAIQFYMYPYYWTFYVVVFGLFVLSLLLLKRYALFKKVIIMLLGVFILATPYLVGLYKSYGIENYNESIIRLGMLDTHFPSGINIVFPGAFLILLFLFSLKKRIIKTSDTVIFLLCGVLGSMVVVNQHIITGKNLEFSSHYSLISHYWYFIAVFYLWHKITVKYEYKKINVMLVILLMILVGNNIYTTVSKQLSYREFEIERQEYTEIFNWLNDNTKKDSVVYANNVLSSYIPAYTHNNVFYTRNANLFYISDEEVFERFVINNYYNKFNEKFLRKNERAIWGTRFINEYAHNQSKNKLRAIFFLDKKEYVRIPEEKLELALKKASKIKEKDFFSLLDKRRVDYLILEKNIAINLDKDKAVLELDTANFNILKMIHAN